MVEEYQFVVTIFNVVLFIVLSKNIYFSRILCPLKVVYILFYVRTSYIFDNLSTVYNIYIVWYEKELNYKQVILSKA